MPSVIYFFHLTKCFEGSSFSFIFIFNYACVGEGLCAHECSTCGGQETALDLPVPAVTNGCELFDEGAGNRIQVLCKNSVYT